jgi:hypothetical protein
MGHPLFFDFQGERNLMSQRIYRPNRILRLLRMLGRKDALCQDWFRGWIGSSISIFR